MLATGNTFQKRGSTPHMEEGMDHDFYVIEADNGTTIVANCPGTVAEARNALPDAEGDITVFFVACIETERHEIFTVKGE